MMMEGKKDWLFWLTGIGVTLMGLLGLLEGFNVDIGFTFPWLAFVVFWWGLVMLYRGFVK
jgi:hypothetical protein